MGVVFGYLLKLQNDKDDVIKLPAVYVLMPHANDNIIISKESMIIEEQFIEGYTIRSGFNNGIHFVQNTINGMTDDECDDILVILDFLLKNIGKELYFISTSDVQKLKLSQYRTISSIRKARKNINIEEDYDFHKKNLLE